MYIERCLASLKKQRYNGTFEILVVKGGNRAQARNFGIKQAEGKIIAFIDSDCVASENWLPLLVHDLNKDKTLGGMGGVNLSPENGPILGKAIDFVFSSYLGSLGSASLHVPSKSKPIHALACINSAFWKHIIKDINGFDEEFELCEDTNLSYKVRQSGHKLLFNPHVLVWHYRRDSIKRFAKQFFLYGLGRMRSIMTNKVYASKSAIIPFLIVLIFPVIAWLLPLAAVSGLAVYLMAIFIKVYKVPYKLKKQVFCY